MLHHAARQGELNEVKRLIALGMEVDSIDQFGSTPLHIAAIYGDSDMAALLIAHHANVNAMSYAQYNYGPDYRFTPLDLAVKYTHNTDIIYVLLAHEATSSHWGMLSGHLISRVHQALDNKNYPLFDLSLNIFEILAAAAPEVLWLNYDIDGFEVPLNILLTEVAFQCNENEYKEYYDRLNLAIERIEAFDMQHIAQHYDIAKNLLHAFPSDNVYDFQIDNNHFELPAEGYYASFTLPAAAKSLALFSQNISDPFKQNIFNEVTKLFLQASNTSNIDKLYSLYINGETVLLPSGWYEHAIEIILNKDLNLIAIGNGGDRYPELSPGFLAYHHTLPITLEDFHFILTNEDKMDLEFKFFYEKDLEYSTEYSILTPNQEFGNCAWNSLLIAQQGLLFLTLTEQLSIEEAKLLSTQWFSELEDFHQTRILKEYLMAPTLEAAAIEDILVHYHDKLDTENKTERAQLILNNLHPAHQEEFKTYCNTHQKEFTKDLKQLLKHNHIDYCDVISDDVIAFNEHVNQPNAVDLVLTSISPLPPLIESVNW